MPSSGVHVGYITHMSVNVQLARLFSEISLLLELQEANPFKIRAYSRASQALEALSDDIGKRVEDGTVQEIPGIGRDLAEKIAEYLETGTVAEYLKLKKDVPPILVEMTRIPGLGPKNALKLHRELGIESLEQLESACRSGDVAGLKGFGPKSAQNIVEGIAFVQRSSERTALGRALPYAEEFIETLSTMDEVEQISTAGSLRRMKESVGDVDIVVGSAAPKAVMDAFTSHQLVGTVLAKGRTKSSIRTIDDLQVDLRVVEPAVFGAALMHFTGSKEHNVRLREMARKKDLKINEYGIFDVSGTKEESGEKAAAGKKKLTDKKKEEAEKKKKGTDSPTTGRRLSAATEEECFEVLGLPWIPPELREDSGEIQAALEGRLPDLIDDGDIRGELHVHTDASDGKMTLEDLIEAVRSRGWSYIGITDHSESLKIANGLDQDRMKWQIERIREADERHKGIRVLAGTEVDILKEGGLDYPDDLLKELDIVIASVHTHFRLSREDQTKRICDAMANPYVNIVGHLTGRMIGVREAYEVDVEKAIETAAETGTAMEINAHPIRLDLNDRHARMAKQAGVALAICTDAHSTGQLDLMRYGVKVARRAWLEPGDVLNTLKPAALLKALHKKRPK